MTTIPVHDSDGAAPGSAKLTPLPMAALAIATWNLLEEGSDLPQPRYISVSNTQSIDLQFQDGHRGGRAVERWARRFNDTVRTTPHTTREGKLTSYVRAEFDYHGITVTAYAFIYATPATT